MKRNIFLVFSVLAISGSMLLGSYISSLRHGSEKHFEDGTVLAPPQSLEGLRLLDSQGSLVDQNSFKGRWTLLTFGFTHCPDVCPVTLAYLKGELDHLPQDRFEVRFVSVDPDMDSPADVENFVKAFDKRMRGYLAPQDSLPTMERLFGLYAKKNPDGTLSHSNAIFVINPDGQWVAVYNKAPQKGVVAKELKRIALR